MKSHKEAAPLLKVEHLCQYFKSVKAVDDVSFDIKEGEVFGLVGESGCGKTTTGRSIIKIYDITSGNIYFKGKRICAGIQSYQEAIRTGKREAAERIKLLRQEIKEKPEKRAENNAGIAEERRKLKELIVANKEEIRRARKDQGESFDGKGNKFVTAIYNKCVEYLVKSGF